MRERDLAGGVESQQGDGAARVGDMGDEPELGRIGALQQARGERASLPMRSATSLVSTAGLASMLRSLAATGGKGGTFFKLAEMVARDLCM